MAKNITIIRQRLESSYIEQYHLVLFYSHIIQCNKRIKPYSRNYTILVDLALYSVNTQSARFSASVLVRCMQRGSQGDLRGVGGWGWGEGKQVIQALQHGYFSLIMETKVLFTHFMDNESSHRSNCVSQKS